MKKLFGIIFSLLVLQSVCFAQSNVSFVYINGSNNNDAKMRNWYVNGVEKLHPVMKKKFEKNKLRFCDKRLKIEFIEMREYVNKIRLNHQKIQDQEYQHFIMRRFKYTRPSEETEALSTKMNEVKLMIQNLNKEISENQQLINYLISILKPFKITKC